MRPLNNRTAFALVCAILAWLLAQWLTLDLSAGGDGWNGPFLLTLPLLLLFPIVSIRFFAPDAGATKVDRIVPFIAGALDALLLFNVTLQERSYAARTWQVAAGVVTTWFILWLAWQALALVTLFRKAHAAEQP